jgi:NADH:ubiquinone oxidoreductase subunit E
MNIYVCVGSACHIKGSYNIINELQQLIDEKKLGEEVTVKAALCLGKCTSAVSVRIDEEEVISVSSQSARSTFEKVFLEKLGV